MIPYVTIPKLDIFGLELRPFFLLVALGIVVGIVVYDRICLRGGIDRRAALHLPELCVLGGFIGAHLVHVLFYNPELLAEDPWVLFKFWGGISSIGGFFGGVVAGVGYLKWKRLAVLPYGDRILFGLTVGWIFGRTGCAVTHDHPGLLTDFPLAVAFPGGARHDLGLYELCVTIALAAILFSLSKKPRRHGVYMGVLLTLYSPIRFFLDFLRATEGRYADNRMFGLTAAQYGVIVLFGIGVYLLATRNRRPMDVAFLGPRPAVGNKSEGE